VGAPQHSPRERLLRAPEGVGAGPRDVRERVEVPPLEDPHGLLVLQAARVLLERLVKALQGALQPVLLEVAEPQLEDGFLRVGLKLQRLLEVADCAGDIPLFPQDGAEEDVGRGLRRHVQRLQELPLRLGPAGRVRVESAEGEVWQERVGAAADRLLVEGLGRLDLPRLARDDPGIDERLEVGRLDRENFSQVPGCALHVPRREEGLREVEAELRVRPVRLVELLQGADPAVRVEREERELGLTEALHEVIAVDAREAGHDPVPPLEEPVLLLHRLHPFVELRLPEVPHFLGADDPAPLQRLLEGDHAGVRDEQVPLEVSERLEERLDGVSGALDHFLERRDPLQEVLVERDLFLRLSPLFDDSDSREHEKLRLTADAELLVVGVPGAADLAEHQAADAG